MPDTERRVYLFPAELLARIRAYQAAHGITSEVEAARRLLTYALYARDTPEDLMRQLAAHGGTLREAAADVLMPHQLVTSIRFIHDRLEFDMAGRTMVFPRREAADA